MPWRTLRKWITRNVRGSGAYAKNRSSRKRTVRGSADGHMKAVFKAVNIAE